MISTDRYLHRRYDRQSYNCLNFARDVWFDITGVDIVDRLQMLFRPVVDRQMHREYVRNFDVLVVPEDPCLVLMQRQFGEPHIGVFLRGRVLHLHEAGVEYMPVDVASRGFTNVRYFRPC